MNESCLLKDENALDNIFFLFFLFYNDETKQGMKSHSFCFSFLHCLVIVSNSRKTKQSSFFLDCDLRKRDFDQIGRNDRNLNRICKACFEFVFFFLLFDLRIVEKEKCGKRFEICLFATIGEIRERMKERKEKCDFLHLSNWMKLPRDWIG